MRTRTLAALTLCLLVASGAVAATGAAGPASNGASPSTLSAAPASHALPTQSTGPATELRPASVQEGDIVRPLTVQIQVQPGGDARFTIRKEYPAETEAQRDAFWDDPGEPFEEGEYSLGYDAVRTVAPNVSEHAGREMSVENPDRGAFVENGTGVIERRFTWRNFGNVSEGRIVVEDAFYTEDGPWLEYLPAHFRLVLRSPEGYRISHSQEGISRDGKAIVWEASDGESRHAFQEGEFRTVFVEDTFPFERGSLLAAGSALIVLGALAYLLSRRYDFGGQRDDVTAADGEGATAAPTGAEAASTPDAEDVPGTGTGDGGPAGATGQSVDAAGGAAAAESDVADGQDPEDGEDDAVDPELLSDEERVERLLEENGGRMKQATIVDETGWSNAKVSQLLSEMAENDRVDKLRIGRENLISLPDEDVTATE